MILLIDNYDSFTYNLYQYVGEFDNNIKVYRNDEINCNDLNNINPDKIIISPGPKSPDEAGNCVSIIKKFSGSIPILGICLGHQCIGKAFGSNITYAKKLFHGKTSTIEHNNSKIFTNISNCFKAARYHSLVIDKPNLSKVLKVIASTKDGEIMAVEHYKHSTIGLQFHPESIYTGVGKKIIKNFIELY